MRALLLILLASGAVEAQLARVVLSWEADYADFTPDLRFYVYAFGDPALPSSGWRVLTSVDGLARSVELDVEPGANFFTVTASNFWGESEFALPVGTPRVALPPVGFGIRLVGTNGLKTGS